MASQSLQAPGIGTQTMSNGRWLATALGLIVLLIAADLIVSWRMDPFGVLRDAHGRSLLTSEDERRAKFLLSEYYVPDNFNALVIGSSASMNWRTDELTGYRFYNESVEGSSASEERKLVEEALIRGHYKVALVVEHPLITSFHDIVDGLDQVNNVEALGSVGAVELEYGMLRNRRHAHPGLRFPDGRRIKNISTVPQPTDTFPKYDVPVDVVSMRDYRELVQELLDRHIRVIYVTYPLYKPFYEVNKEVLNQYSELFRSQMPAAPIIDFDGPEYTFFRDDSSNYYDKIHLSLPGAEKLTGILNQRMHAILKDQ